MSPRRCHEPGAAQFSLEQLMASAKPCARAKPPTRLHMTSFVQSKWNGLSLALLAYPWSLLSCGISLITFIRQKNCYARSSSRILRWGPAYGSSENTPPHHHHHAPPSHAPPYTIVKLAVVYCRACSIGYMHTLKYYPSHLSQHLIAKLAIVSFRAYPTGRTLTLKY